MCWLWDATKVHIQKHSTLLQKPPSPRIKPAPYIIKLPFETSFVRLYTYASCSLRRRMKGIHIHSILRVSNLILIYHWWHITPVLSFEIKAPQYGKSLRLLYTIWDFWNLRFFFTAYTWNVSSNALWRRSIMILLGK